MVVSEDLIELLDRIEELYYLYDERDFDCLNGYMFQWLCGSVNELAENEIIRIIDCDYVEVGLELSWAWKKIALELFEENKKLRNEKQVS